MDNNGNSNRGGNEAVTPQKLAVERYRKLQRPALKIFLLALVCFSLLLAAAFILIPDTIKIGAEHTTDRLTFMFYFSIFIANWLVYFRSKKTNFTNDGEGIQSLRRLLGETSKHWNKDTDLNNSKEKHDSFRDKASTSMAVIAILIAVSIMMLDLIRNTMYSSNMQLDDWQLSFLGMAAMLSVISFFSFVISIDALDTIFNNFEESGDANVVIQYFYSFTINPKYIGMITMISSLIIVMQVYSEVMASISIAIVMYLGYYLWYPKIDATMAELGVTQAAVDTGTAGVKAKRITIKTLVLLFLCIPLLTHYLF